MYFSTNLMHSNSHPHLITTWKQTASWTNKNSETWLLENIDVVVVGVPHGPPTGVPLGFLTIRSKDKSAVTVSPLGPSREPRRDLKTIYRYKLSQIFLVVWNIFWWYDCEQLLMRVCLVQSEWVSSHETIITITITISHLPQTQKLIFIN